MKLQQGQLWKQGDDYYRIVEWARMAIDYKATKTPSAAEGTRHKVSKKEFCRLIKGAELIESEPDLATNGGQSAPGCPPI